jgi:hypothetical protein
MLSPKISQTHGQFENVVAFCAQKTSYHHRGVADDFRQAKIGNADVCDIDL